MDPTGQLNSKPLSVRSRQLDKSGKIEDRLASGQVQKLLKSHI
jgi:hypothetical protein